MYAPIEKGGGWGLGVVGTDVLSYFGGWQNNESGRSEIIKEGPI